MSRLEHEGRFLANIIDYGIFEAKKSRSVAVDLRFETITFFNPDGSESEWSGYGVRGRVFIIGKTGDVLQANATSLADATGWDGDLREVAQKTWSPQSPVQIIVEPEKYEGRTYFRAERVLRADWQPSRAGNVSEDDGRRIADRYTSALQSIVAKHSGNGQPDRKESEKSEKWTAEKVWPEFGGDEAKWKEAIAHFAGGKAVGEISQEEWAQIAAIDPQTWTPEMPPAGETGEWTPEMVWAKFQSNAVKMDSEQIEKVWDQALQKIAEGKALDELTQAQLAQLAFVDPVTFTPF